MTLKALLDTADGLAIELWLDGDRVRYRAPAGVDTAAFLVELRQHKMDVALLLGDQELLALLRAGIDEDLAYSAVERRSIIDADAAAVQS